MLRRHISLYHFLTLFSAALYIGSLWASPSFNNNRKNLEGLSREAGAELQASFRIFHDMFYWLEKRDVKKVEERRGESLASLDKALGLFKTLAEKAPKQDLVLKPQTNSDRAAVDRLKQRLQSQKLDFPKTEEDLARLAVTVVSKYRVSLAEIKLTGNRSDNPALLRIIGDKGFVEELGILSTIAWDISE